RLQRRLDGSVALRRLIHVEVQQLAEVGYEQETLVEGLRDHLGHQQAGRAEERRQPHELLVVFGLRRRVHRDVRRCPCANPVEAAKTRVTEERIERVDGVTTSLNDTTYP